MAVKQIGIDNFETEVLQTEKKLSLIHISEPTRH